MKTQRKNLLAEAVRQKCNAEAMCLRIDRELKELRKARREWNKILGKWLGEIEQLANVEVTK